MGAKEGEQGLSGTSSGTVRALRSTVVLMVRVVFVCMYSVGTAYIGSRREVTLCFGAFADPVSTSLVFLADVRG